MASIIIKDTTAQADLAAAEIISALVRQNPRAVLGLPTGQTPVGMYAQLVRMHREQHLSFRQIRTVNLDEYAGLSPENKNSYRYFMQDNLFGHVDIAPQNTHVPDGAAPDIHKECERYERMIGDLGGIDLMVLGMGSNGHIGFNEPGSPADSVTHVVELSESTIADNSVYFDSAQQMPGRALTMGIATILGARAILLIVKGRAKAGVLKAALFGPVTADIPASYLQTHPAVTVVLDAAAASLL